MKDEVKKIVNCKVDQGKRYFEVVWKSSWEAEEFIRGIAEELVEEFLRLNKEIIPSSGDYPIKDINHDRISELQDAGMEQYQDDDGIDTNDDVPRSPDINSTVEVLNNGSSPKPKKSRKGGINSVISRLQKNQQEGLLKQFDGQLPEPNHDSEQMDIEQSRYTHQTSSNTTSLRHTSGSSTNEYPRSWNMRENEMNENELQMQVAQTGTKTTHSKDYLPSSPQEAPLDAREGTLPTQSAGSAFYKPVSSGQESPSRRFIPASNRTQTPTSSSSLQNLKSNVENISKLFSAARDQSSPERTAVEGGLSQQHPINIKPTGTVFKCTICSDIFYEESKFKQHMFMHEQVNILKQEAPKLLKPGTFECKFCHLIFNDKDKLKLHYSEEHEKEFVYTQPIDQLYQCTLCEQSFVDYNKLLHHHQTHQQSRREVFILPKKPAVSATPFVPGTPRVGSDVASSGALTLVHHHATPQLQEKMRSHENISGENQGPASNLSPDHNEKMNTSGNVKNDMEDVFEDETETVEPVSDEMLMKAAIKDETEEHIVTTEYGDKKMYRCNLCDEMFETEDDRAKHSLVHVNRSSSLDCHICGKQFRHRTNLSTHLIVHSGVKPHQCHICLRRFTQKVNLQRHMHIHDGSRPFTCRMCSKSFTQKANLQRHILSHTEHSKEELLVALNEIPNESEVNNAINESLTEAMSVVMEQKSAPDDRDQKPEFQCDVCDKTFAQKVNLQKHVLIHSGTRPFQCYVCGKSFRQRASLQKHYSVHTNGSSSFICQTCNRLFVSRTNLQRHMLVHALPGKNQCFLCDQKFTSTDNLERHFSEHIEEATPNIALPMKYFEQATPGQTFRCATCDIVFDSPIVFSQHLQCHQKVFSPDINPNDLTDLSKNQEGNQHVQLQCTACGLVFPSIAKLEAHMILHSTEESNKNGEKFVSGPITKSPSPPSEQNEPQIYARISPSSHPHVASTLLVPVTSHTSIVTVKQEESIPATTNGTHAPRVSRCPVCKEMFPSKAEMRAHYSVSHLESPSPGNQEKPTDSLPESVHMPGNNEQPLGLDEDNSVEPDDPSDIQAGIISESEERLIKENEEFIKDNILGGPAEYESKGRYERGNYSCKICNRVLTYKYSLEKHMLLHTGSFPYKCHLCSKRFNHKANYDKHLIVHRGEKPYSCHICARPFSQKSNLQRHQLTHTQNRDFICDVCGKRFNHMASLKTHSLIHTGAKPFSCYICTKRFNQKGNLKRHIQTHRTGKRNKISGLGESDADIDNLLKSEIENMVSNEHMETRIKVENPKKNPYEYMEKESASMVMQDDSKFYMMAAKVEHELSQMENQDEYYKGKEIKMEEPPAPSRRSQRPRQKKHMDDYEFLDDDEPLPTMIAGEEFQNTINSAPSGQPGQSRGNNVGAYPVGYEGEQILTVLPSDAMYGEEVETKVFPPPESQPEMTERKETFHCGQCSKLFISMASLEAHKRHAHSFIMCDICGRPFSQKANLLKHKLIHANKKPFSCRVCSKAFRQKANLQRHELIHDKDRKTVNCTECNKSFRCAWSLKQHMKNHNSGGAYGCSICGKTFKGKDRLMQHFSIHNQLGVFTCHLCEMKFPSPEHLLKHLETHGTFPVPSEEGAAAPTMSRESREPSMTGDNLVIVTNPDGAEPEWGDSNTNVHLPDNMQSKTIISSENPPVAIINNEMLNGAEPPEVTNVLTTVVAPTP